MGVDPLVAAPAVPLSSSAAAPPSDEACSPDDSSATPARRNGRTAQRRARPAKGEPAATKAPFAGTKVLRMGLALCLGSMAVVTLAGGVLMLLLWREGTESGILESHIERTWDLVDRLRTTEVLIAYLVVPVATIWIALAAVNVCRATSRRVYAAGVAALLPPAVFAAWRLSVEVVEPADAPLAIGIGIALQALVLAVPLVGLEFVAMMVDARRRPFRAAYVITIALLAHVQIRGGLATIEVTSDSDEWGPLAAYLIIAALLQVLGALAVNEGCRSFEEAAQYRYEMRRAFGGTVLGNAPVMPAAVLR